MDRLGPWAARFAASAYAHTAAAHAASFVPGTLIGLDRRWRQRSAGCGPTSWSRSVRLPSPVSAHAGQQRHDG